MVTKHIFHGPIDFTNCSKAVLLFDNIKAEPLYKLQKFL